MALQYKSLGSPAFIPSSVGSVLTCAAGKKLHIRGIRLFNANASARTVKLWEVPNNAGSLGTQADVNQFFERSLAAKETLFIEFPYTLTLGSTNDAIFGECSAASSVNIKFLGEEDS